MKSRGADSSSAVANMVRDSIRQGGTQAQDPHARTMTRLGGMVKDPGDIQQLRAAGAALGDGSVLDSKIRELQREGEKGGFTDELRAQIAGLRQTQTDMTQDARSMKQFSIKPSGGGGGGFAPGRGVGVAGGGGMNLASIAEALAAYKAQLNFNQSSPFADGSQNRLAQLEQREQIGQLQKLYDMLMEREKMQTEMMREQQYAQRAAMQKANTGGGGVFGGQREGDNDDDPYKAVRDGVVSAAMQYMRKRNPHSGVE